jgi:hypothetical protein
MGPAQRPRRFSLPQTQRPARLASFGLSREPEVPTLVGGSGSETRRSRLFQDLMATGGSPSGWMGRRQRPAGLGWLTLSSEPDILRRFSWTRDQCCENPTTVLRRNRASIRTGGFLILSQFLRAAVTIPCLEPLFFDFLRTVLRFPKNRAADSGGLWSVPVSDNPPLINQTKQKNNQNPKTQKKKKKKKKP